MDVTLHEALFECATTAWISADAFMSEEVEFRKPAINSCLEIAGASALLGRNLLSPMEFRKTLHQAISILDDHCHNAEHCLITLKCWKQLDRLINGMK